MSATNRKKVSRVLNVIKKEKRKNKKIGSRPKLLDARGIDLKNGIGKIDISYPETDFRALGDLGKW